MEEFETFFGLINTTDNLDVECFGDDDFISPSLFFVTMDNFERVLNDLNPHYVIIYDSDLAAIRNLELYKAYNPGHPLKVHLMTHS